MVIESSYSASPYNFDLSGRAKDDRLRRHGSQHPRDICFQAGHSLKTQDLTC